MGVGLTYRKRRGERAIWIRVVDFRVRPRAAGGMSGNPRKVCVDEAAQHVAGGRLGQSGELADVRAAASLIRPAVPSNLVELGKPFSYSGRRYESA
jgi:hypothetical protein